MASLNNIKYNADDNADSLRVATKLSPTVEHQSVSVTSLTKFSALSSVRGGPKIFHYFFRNSTVTKSLMPLIMKGPRNTGTTRRWIHHFWSILEFSRPWCKLLWEHASPPKTLTSGVVQTFHSVYLTTKYHHISIRITTAFKFSTSDVRCSPDLNV